MSTLQIITPARALQMAAEKVASLQGGPASVQQVLHKHGILMSIEDCRKALESIESSKPEESLEDLMVWADGTWSYREEMYMMQHMSDDYQTLYFDTVAYNEFQSIQGLI